MKIMLIIIMNDDYVLSSANSQISWGGAKFFYDVENFFLRSHAKNPVSSPPELKSIHVLNGTKASYACTY